jgi:hypothetical protein
MLAKPLDFNDLSLNDHDQDFEREVTRGGPDSEQRLMEMLAAQAAHSLGPGFEDEDAIATDDKKSEDQKKEMLQKALNMAASNGNVDQVKKILDGKARQYVDINAPDEDGTPPLIYASCFVCYRLGPFWQRRGSADGANRAMRRLCARSSTLELTWTGKTATSGAR